MLPVVVVSLSWGLGTDPRHLSHVGVKRTQRLVPVIRYAKRANH